MAGHLGLGNLIALYDDNRITIEGDTELAFSEDVTRRYEGHGWHTERVDGHDHDAIARAIQDLYPTLAVEIQVEKLAPPCRGAPQASGVRLICAPRS